MWKHNPRLGIFFQRDKTDKSIPKGELCYANNPDSLFRKYANLVTEFANLQAGSEYLGIPKEKYSLLLPNGFQISEGNQHYLEVTTRPVFAYKLYPALAGLDNCLEYVNGWEDALDFLLSATGLSKRTHPLEFAYMEDSSTFNPNANPEVTSVDASVGNTLNASWSTVRSSSVGNSASDSSTQVNCSSDYITFSGRNDYNITRTFLLFDTSSLGSNSTVTGGSLSLYCFHANRELCLVQSSPASNIGITINDYNQCGTLNSPDEGITRSTPTINTTWSPSLNSTGYGWITNTGITKFGLRTSKDVTNTAPTDDNSGGPRFYSAENGISNDPQLTVNYTTTSTSTTTTSTSTSTTTSSSTSTSTTTTSTSTTTTVTTSTSTSTTTTSTSTSTTTTSTSTTTTSTSTSTTTVTVPREFVIDNPAA